MWLPRQIAEELRNVANTFPAVVLIGPRQVGKTSLVQQLFAGHAYVGLDMASHAEAAETRPDEFIGRFAPPVVLDEIQYAPSFFRYIKTVVDSRKGQNGLFVLTGSQNFLLMEAVAESLAGRAAVIPLLGLSGAEWAAAFNVASGDPRWRDFLWQGGYPGLWAEPDSAPSRDRWYQGYMATYLERDVRNLLHVGSLRDFERFLRACAARCSQSLNLSELGRDVGISTTTAKQWLSVLQASNQIFLLEPYHRSLGKRLVKTPKLYFTDTGLAAFLMGFASARDLWASTGAGPIWENHVVNQWLRHRDWFEPGLGLWYWRDQGGNEVDLLLERNQTLTAVECKLTEKPRSADLKGIHRLIKFYGRPMIAHAYLACPIAMGFDIDAGVTAVPGWTTWTLAGPSATTP